MHCTRKITDDIYYVGGSDRKLSLFENIFPISRGVSYNSYLLMDEKNVLLDTVDYSIGRQFIENIRYVLGDKKLDYLIINHMEPDHQALISQVVAMYPDVTIVGNAKTFQIYEQFFGKTDDSNKLVVKEGDELSTGKHTLSFVMAPMVHWPEVMATYDSYSRALFSADAFGSFGALNGNIFNDEVDFDRDFLPDARRYYANIVGKYGVQVKTLLGKTSGLDIGMICPLHGPVWRTDLEYIIDKYNKWSSYEPEEEGVVIAYASMYGNTENAANVMANLLAEKGVKKIDVFDVSKTHVSEIISEMFRFSKIVLATPTYNGGIYPMMESLVLDMKALNLMNRKIAVIDNGTWAATAGKQVKAIVETMKNMEICEGGLSIKSAVNEDGMENLKALADQILS